MLTKESIPAGYCLKISSWENDADNGKDEFLYGLSRADVLFYLKLLMQFRSTNAWENPGIYGNQEIEEGQEIAAIEHAFETSPPDSPSLVAHIQELIQEFREEPEFLEDLIGTWGWDCIGGRWRVFDGFDVYFVPQECHNVTSEFQSPDESI